MSIALSGKISYAKTSTFTVRRYLFMISLVTQTMEEDVRLAPVLVEQRGHERLRQKLMSTVLIGGLEVM